MFSGLSLLTASRLSCCPDVWSEQNSFDIFVAIFEDSEKVTINETIIETTPKMMRKTTKIFISFQMDLNMNSYLLSSQKHVWRSLRCRVPPSDHVVLRLTRAWDVKYLFSDLSLPVSWSTVQYRGLQYAGRPGLGLFCNQYS